MRLRWLHKTLYARCGRSKPFPLADKLKRSHLNCLFPKLNSDGPDYRAVVLDRSKPRVIAAFKQDPEFCFEPAHVCGVLLLAAVVLFGGAKQHVATFGGKYRFGNELAAMR